jgi:hypothetical protein
MLSQAFKLLAEFFLMWHLLLGSFPTFRRLSFGLDVLFGAAFKIFTVVIPTDVAEPQKQEKG